MDTCTTKNDSNLGPQRANLVGMVGFSTLLKSEDPTAISTVHHTSSLLAASPRLVTMPNDDKRHAGADALRENLERSRGPRSPRPAFADLHRPSSYPRR